MKTILILALICATFAPAAEPSTVTFDGKTQQVLIVENQPDGILVATSTGTRKLKAGEYVVHRTITSPSPPRINAVVQQHEYNLAMEELAARERERRAAERAAAAQRQMAEEARAIAEELHDIRTWMILEEARKRGINIAIYR